MKNAGGGTRTRTPQGHRILSPARLPIPPLPLLTTSTGVIGRRFQSVKPLSRTTFLPLHMPSSAHPEIEGDSILPV